MRLSDGTILMHKNAVYDPVKAHAYYMRTRHLKGRRKGGTEIVVPRQKSRLPIPEKLSSKQRLEEQAAVAERITRIKQNLAKLSMELKKLMSEAQTKKAVAKRKASKGPTAAEKSKAARESKKYREKNEQKLATKRRQASAKETAKPRSETDPVAELQNKIAQVKGRLEAALARQRQLSGSPKLTAKATRGR